MWLTTMFPFFCPSAAVSKKMEQYENDIELQNTFVNLLNIALYSFSFKGLPDTCDERFFKLSLLLNGYAGFINDKELGYLTLGIRPIASKYNMYGYCSDVSAFGWNGFNKTYKAYMPGTDNDDAECIICRDNEMMYPFVYILLAYARRLTDTMRSLDVCAKKLKTPYFITCDESQKSSIKKILDDVNFNKDAIIANRSTMPNEFNVLQTGVSGQNLTALWQHYSNIESEIRTYLGINSAANLDKKERLVVDEAEANNILTDININIRLDSYKEFCKLINSKFGLNISVVSNIQNVEDKEEAKNENSTIKGQYNSDTKIQ